MSDEVIKVIDALAERFGIVIDWNSENVIPYLQQLCDKYITYEIITSIVWMIIGVCLLPVSKYAVKRMKYNAEQKTIDRLADYDTRETLWGLLAGATIVVGVGIIVYQVFDIITCFTFPEDMIIGKLQVIYSRMKQ